MEKHTGTASRSPHLLCGAYKIQASCWDGQVSIYTLKIGYRCQLLEAQMKDSGKFIEDTSVWCLVYWWSKAGVGKSISQVFKPLLIFLSVKRSVSFHLVALGRLLRKEDSWISHPPSSSHCSLAAWGSSPFFGCCSGCGCELTCREQWWWSPGPPLAWEKVGTDRRVPKAG